MNIDNKLLFTTNENIKNFVISKFNLKKENIDWFEIYLWKRETENETDNLIFVFSKVEDIDATVAFIKEKYLIFKYILLWASYIIRNQDIEVWDIMIPNSFVDENGNNPIFLDYAVWENFDLIKFGLILNWVCSDRMDYADIINSDESYFDIVDNDSYKFLKNLTKEDLETAVNIRICIENEKNLENNYFLENLLNIVDVMI